MHESQTRVTEMANGFCNQHEDVQKRLSRAEAACSANKESITLERATRVDECVRMDSNLDKEVKLAYRKMDKDINQVEDKMDREFKGVKKLMYITLSGVVVTWLTVVVTVIVHKW